jgi:glycosyltransferase involved in cell wall biosynthesis
MKEYDVAILLCTLNGNKYLEDQLNSIFIQSHKKWKIFVSYDGSIDDTKEILERFKHKIGSDKITIINGPRKGYAENFMSLAVNAEIKADFYFFCDQDDIWFENKIERSIYFINRNGPCLYGSSTMLGDKKGKVYGLSPIFNYPKNFRNALVQCVVGGNTLAFNHEFKKIIEKVGVVSVVSHDWWLYQLITAMEGFFHYDKEPSLIYRQHPQSIIGNNVSIAARVNRVGMVLNNRYRKWNDVNINALDHIEHLMKVDTKDSYRYFKLARQAHSLKDRIRLMNISGVYRQSRWGTFSLFIAVLFGKV